MTPMAVTSPQIRKEKHMAWVINNFEPIYVDDPWDDPNYDPRVGDISCGMCPLTLEECDNRRARGEVCYWTEVWASEDEEGRQIDG